MRTLLAVVLLTLVSCSTRSAALQDIDRFVGTTLQTLPEIPSIGLAVVYDGKQYVRAYGLANRERGVAADANTGYYNGSNTKAYTALLCTMLAEQGKLSLDAPVTTYLPELRFDASIAPEQVTLRRFLSHTSGISNYGIVFRTAYSGEHTPEELVRLLSLSKRAKDGFRYDNLGYVVASLVIQRVTGLQWQDALEQHLFRPLGMPDTTAYMSAARARKLASPYAMSGNGVMTFTEFGWKVDSTMHAAGGIVTTPADLAKFMEATLTRGRVGARQLIAAAAFDETHRKQAEAKRDSFLFDGTGYGFGWYQSDLHGEPLLYHGGGYTGWRSVYSFLPAKGIAVGAMTNAGLSHSPLELVSAYVYDRLLNRPDVDATYAEKLAQLRARFDTVKKSEIADSEKRAARTWTLTHPLRNYAGVYESPTMGALTIEERDGKLVASIARLSGVLEPYTDPDSARVELIPGNGGVLQFRFTDGPSPASLQWDEEVLVRNDGLSSFAEDGQGARPRELPYGPAVSAARM